MVVEAAVHRRLQVEHRAGPCGQQACAEQVHTAQAGVAVAGEEECAVAVHEGVHLIAGGVHLGTHVLGHAPVVAQVVAEPDVRATLAADHVAHEKDAATIMGDAGLPHVVVRVVVVEGDQVAPLLVAELAGGDIGEEDAQLELAVIGQVLGAVEEVVAREVEAVGEGVEAGRAIVEAAVHVLAHHHGLLGGLSLQQGAVEVEEGLVVPLVGGLAACAFATGAAEEQELLQHGEAQVGLRAVDGHRADAGAAAVAVQAVEKVGVLHVGLRAGIARVLLQVARIELVGLGVLAVAAQHLGVVEEVLGAGCAAGELGVGGLRQVHAAHALVGHGQAAQVGGVRLALVGQVLVHLGHRRIVEVIGVAGGHALLELLGAGGQGQRGQQQQAEGACGGAVHRSLVLRHGSEVAR